MLVALLLQVPLLQLLQLLVDAGADVAAQDALGRTPLQVAIETGNTPCVGFLALREWHSWNSSDTWVLQITTVASSHSMLADVCSFGYQL
jgi:hypothetical protein